MTRQRVNTDPDSVERDLVRLALTIVELLRQLMERQALRRIEAETLRPDEEERLGLALMLLADRMAMLRDRYGLSEADLNLDLGPLGPLLPRSGPYGSPEPTDLGPTTRPAGAEHQ